MKSLVIALAAAALSSAPVLAQEATKPAFADAFNVTDTSVDLSKLTRQNFYETLVPIAKKSGELTFYSFWPPTPLIVFQEQIIPAFEKKYGIKVNYMSVESTPGLQQIDAAYREKKPAPTDAYFVPDLPANLDEIANIRLIDLLPNAADLNPALSLRFKGVTHNGSYLPFHGNQTVMAYNTAFVTPQDMPQTFEGLLDYAKAHPGTVAVTSPLRGGSGGGFLVSAAHHLMSKDCNDRFMSETATADDAKALLETGECFAPVWSYFKDLLAVSQLTNGNTDTLNLMANGVAHIGTAWEDLTFSFISGKQLPDTVRVTILEDGQTGGAEGVFIPSNAKNLAAAMLFVDEMLAPEHQAWKLTNFASRSAKTSLDASLIPAEAQKYLVPNDIYAKGQLARPTPMMSKAATDAFVKNVLEK